MAYNGVLTALGRSCRLGIRVYYEQNTPEGGWPVGQRVRIDEPPPWGGSFVCSTGTIFFDIRICSRRANGAGGERELRIPAAWSPQGVKVPYVARQLASYEGRTIMIVVYRSPHGRHKGPRWMPWPRVAMKDAINLR